MVARASRAMVVGRRQAAPHASRRAVDARCKPVDQAWLKSTMRSLVYILHDVSYACRRLLTRRWQGVNLHRTRVILVPLGPAEMDEKPSVSPPLPTSNTAARRFSRRTEGPIGPTQPSYPTILRPKCTISARPIGTHRDPRSGGSSSCYCTYLFSTVLSYRIKSTCSCLLLAVRRGASCVVATVHR